MVRKFLRIVLLALIVLGAIGGIGTIVHVNSKPVMVHSQTQVDYSEQRSFAAAFATMYLTITPNTTRESVLQPFVGDANWVGTDPAISSVPSNAVSQSVLHAFAEKPTVLDSSHLMVPVLVDLATKAGRNTRWIALNVPVGFDSNGMNVYAAPAITTALNQPGNVQDKQWAGNIAGSDISGPIQSTLTNFLPQYYSATDVSSITPYVASGYTITPMGGLLQFSSIQNLSVYGTVANGPWVVVTDVKVTDPVTNISYLQELTIGMKQEAGHDLITAVVAN